MSNLNVLTNERLNKLIDDTQATLDELRLEMARRESVEQEREIEDLDQHIESTELSLATIRNFINFLLTNKK